MASSLGADGGCVEGCVEALLLLKIVRGLAGGHKTSRRVFSCHVSADGAHASSRGTNGCSRSCVTGPTGLWGCLLAKKIACYRLRVASRSLRRTSRPAVTNGGVTFMNNAAELDDIAVLLRLHTGFKGLAR